VLNPTVLEISVAFDAMDFTTANGNYKCLEFIRRYMESGLDAIQPCQELIDAGLVRKPMGYDNGLITFQKALLHTKYLNRLWVYFTGSALAPW